MCIFVYKIIIKKKKKKKKKKKYSSFPFMAAFNTFRTHTHSHSQHNQLGSELDRRKTVKTRTQKSPKNNSL